MAEKEKGLEYRNREREERKEIVGEKILLNGAENQAALKNGE